MILPILNRLFVLLLLVLCGTVTAQSTTSLSASFTGLVTDETQTPLADATVLVQEKNVATRTDAAGRFSLPVTAKDVLIISKAGYLTTQVLADAAPNHTITLKRARTDAGDGDNVIIPFGVRKKREITAAVTSLNTETLPQLPLADVKNLLSGRVPGLYLTQTGTQPGNDGTSFEIRGRSSFGSLNARALVDGVQREFGDMDINEIESVTVLKDAAALAWYGFRGGQGVVLVTTKQGSATRSGIRFDTQVGFQTPAQLIKPLNSYDFATLYNEALTNDGGTPIYDQAALDAYRTGTNPRVFPDNNYIGDFLKRASPVQRYVLSADGGNNTIRYFTLLSYLNQEGLFNQTNSSDYDSNIGFKKFNFRGNVEFNATKNLTITLNAGGRAENRLYPGAAGTETNGATNLLSLLYNTPPNAFPILNENGTYGGSTLYQTNPLAQLQSRGFVSAVDRVLLASLDVRQKLDFWVNGLSAHLLASYDANGTYSSGLNRDYQVFDPTGTAVGTRNQAPLSYRSAAFTNNNRRNEVWVGLDYDRVVGHHSVKASGRAQRAVNASPERLDNRYQGVSARIDYGYNQKYLLGLVAGYSGSENFAPGKRYGLFPAVSVGWITSDEAFLAGNTTVSYLKLRASHGIVGNDQIGGNRFPFQNFYNRNGTGGGYVFGTGFAASNSATESTLGNPDITWETVRMTNAGVDLKFFRNALSVSVDAYQTRRSNILTTAFLPNILGQTLGNVNAGIVDSRGIETAMTYDRQLGRARVSFNGNLLVSADKVISQTGQTRLPEYQQTVGRVAGGQLVYLSDGIFQTADEISRAPLSTLGGRALVPGDIRYKDIGGPNGQPDGLIDGLDRVLLNRRDLPDTYYGFGTVVRYGLLDFSAQFQGVLGRTIDIQPYVNAGPFSFNQESLSRWTPQTATTALYPRVGIADRNHNTVASDFWLRSADYLKLKSVELGVSLPESLSQKLRLQRARVFVGAFNPITFTKLAVDVDPELPGAGRQDNYPYLKTWTAGLSAKF